MKPSARHPLRPQLSGAREMDLWLGTNPHQPAFVNEKERREAWFANRDRLMLLLGAHGRRPMAWWSFESEIPWPGLDRERSALFMAGLLAESERVELLKYWREQFDRACDPNFSLTVKPGEILRGDEARRKHFEWCDLPPTLRKAWIRERKRRAAQIQKLAEASRAEPGV